MTRSERNQMMKKIEATTTNLRAVKKANSVECEGPKMKRTYTYRKSTIILAHDLAI
jgi:hypothetical protein